MEYKQMAEKVMAVQEWSKSASLTEARSFFVILHSLGDPLKFQKLQLCLQIIEETFLESEIKAQILMVRLKFEAVFHFNI